MSAHQYLITNQHQHVNTSTVIKTGGIFTHGGPLIALFFTLRAVILLHSRVKIRIGMF
jgi:hypothetical protein